MLLGESHFSNQLRGPEWSSVISLNAPVEYLRLLKKVLSCNKNACSDQRFGQDEVFLQVINKCLLFTLLRTWAFAKSASWTSSIR